MLQQNKFRIYIEKVLQHYLLFVFLACILILEIIILFEINPVFSIYFLDIGQGDSILIKTPDYRYILIDGGEDETILKELGDILPFWHKHIDLVIGTHADSDHIGGLYPVLDEYTTKAVIMGAWELNDNNLQRIKDVANSFNIPLYKSTIGDSIKQGDLHITCLWPPRDFECENDNQNSIVLLGQYNESSFLLTGDIEADQEKEIIGSIYSASPITLLKVSHHGSKTATSEEFLKAIQPQVGIISCGGDNSFGHPHQEVLDRLRTHHVEILRTDIDGRVVFTYDNGKMNYSCKK